MCKRGEERFIWDRGERRFGEQVRYKEECGRYDVGKHGGVELALVEGSVKAR